MKLCKDCRFAALVEDEDDRKLYWRCEHRSSRFGLGPDYVTGKPTTPQQISCKWARMSDWGEGRCGPEGRYWEARERGFE
jgi:hypothetical protein